MRVHSVQDELTAASKELMDLIAYAAIHGGVSRQWIESVRLHETIADLHRRMAIVVDPANVDPVPGALELIADYRTISASLVAEMAAGKKARESEA